MEPNFHRLINTLDKLEAFVKVHGNQNIRKRGDGHVFVFPGDKGYILPKTNVASAV